MLRRVLRPFIYPFFIRSFRLVLKDLYICKKNWRKLQQKNRYLTYEDSHLIFEKLSNIEAIIPKTKITSYLFQKYIKKIRQTYKDISLEFNSFNDNYVEKEIKRCEDFFSGAKFGFKYGLNTQQSQAIVRDDKHNLVNAGAGSGKTNTLVHKVAYLVTEKNIPPEKILSLCYNTKAAKEVKDRLLNQFNISSKVNTFHSFGNEFLREDKKLVQQKELSEIFKNLFSDINFITRMENFIAYGWDDTKRKEVFNSKEEYEGYLKDRYENYDYITLNQIQVRSFSERIISNFFVTHGIEFEYEKEIEIEGYHFKPDFYLPEFNIYLEHWGINRNEQVPKWFSITSKEYVDRMNLKKRLYKSKGITLLETWEFERFEDSLIHSLKSRLESAVDSFRPTPLTQSQLLKTINSYTDSVSVFKDLIKTFIALSKSNGYTEKKLSQLENTLYIDYSQKKFLEIAINIFEKYEKYLRDNQKIDFSDMINKGLLKFSSAKLSQISFDYILVDEFQDISLARMHFLKKIYELNPNAHLFCVGDDYQAIYSFSGSDVDLFLNFHTYFPHANKMLLDFNYRSPSNIVDCANSVIANNKHQERKVQTAILDTKSNIKVIEIDDIKYPKFVYKRVYAHILESVNNLLSEGVHQDKILVLGRYIKRHKELRDKLKNIGFKNNQNESPIISIHASKGLEAEFVFLIDLNSYGAGFPTKIETDKYLQILNKSTFIDSKEEERRLLYVAITRTQKDLTIYTMKEKRSSFYKEIKNFVSHTEQIQYLKFNEKASASEIQAKT